MECAVLKSSFALSGQSLEQKMLKVTLNAVRINAV
jgi:hypothetical protein